MEVQVNMLSRQVAVAKTATSNQAVNPVLQWLSQLRFAQTPAGEVEARGVPQPVRAARVAEPPAVQPHKPRYYISLGSFYEDHPIQSWTG